jgi:hypothetical protein
MMQYFSFTDQCSQNITIPHFMSLQDFDVFSEEKLPAFDILVVADVLYNSVLAEQIGLRIYESISRALSDEVAFPKIIVTDSQQFHGTNFLVEVEELKEMNKMLLESGLDILHWEERNLKDVIGSGVLLDEDQVYDANVRLIRWGWANSKMTQVGTGAGDIVRGAG